MAKMVVLTALALFTGVGPGGTILHVDPDGLDERAREPIVTEADADFLVDEKKVAKRTKKRVTLEGDLINEMDAANERLADTVDIDTEASDRPSGLDSRQSVNHPRSHGVHGGSTTPPSSAVVVTEPGATGSDTGQDDGTGGGSTGGTGDGSGGTGDGKTADGGTGLDPNDPDAPPVKGAAAQVAKPAAAKGTVPKLSKPANKPAAAKAPAGN